MQIVLKKPTGKKDLLGWLIVGVGKMASGDAKYSHVGVLIGKRIYESLIFGGVACRDYSIAYNKVPHDVVGIPGQMMPILNETDAKAYLEGLLGQFRGIYGFGKIPLQLLDAIVSKIKGERVFWFTKAFSVRSFPICSALVAKVLYEYGATEDIKRAFRDWRGMSPDDIGDTFTVLLNKGEI